MHNKDLNHLNIITEIKTILSMYSNTENVWLPFPKFQLLIKRLTLSQWRPSPTTPGTTHDKSVERYATIDTKIMAVKFCA